MNYQNNTIPFSVSICSFRPNFQKQQQLHVVSTKRNTPRPRAPMKLQVSIIRATIFSRLRSTYPAETLIKLQTSISRRAADKAAGTRAKIVTTPGACSFPSQTTFRPIIRVASRPAIISKTRLSRNRCTNANDSGPNGNEPQTPIFFVSSMSKLTWTVLGSFGRGFDAL